MYTDGSRRASSFLFMGTWAAAVFLGTTACSSTAPPANPPSGALAPGTIDVSVDGQSAGSPRGLACSHISSFTTATAGEGDSTVRAVLDDASGLSTVSVQLTDIGGFTGSYWTKVQGKADASVVGSTFVISGVADGFYTERPSERATGHFTIRFAC